MNDTVEYSLTIALATQLIPQIKDSQHLQPTRETTVLGMLCAALLRTIQRQPEEDETLNTFLKETGTFSSDGMSALAKSCTETYEQLNEHAIHLGLKPSGEILTELLLLLTYCYMRIYTTLINATIVENEPSAAEEVFGNMLPDAQCIHEICDFLQGNTLHIKHANCTKGDIELVTFALKTSHEALMATFEDDPEGAHVLNLLQDTPDALALFGLNKDW